MAKLYFYYSAMNAGKSTHLLQANFNYMERGMITLLFLPDIVAEVTNNCIKSRAGLETKAHTFCPQLNFLNYVVDFHHNIDCILIDEAQFLTKLQVTQLGKIADRWNIPVMCYGLRTDFKGELFEGSGALLAIADTLSEIKTICSCGKKATMNMRIDADGNAVSEGEQIEVGGNDRYVAKCRKCFNTDLNTFGPI